MKLIENLLVADPIYKGLVFLTSLRLNELAHLSSDSLLLRASMILTLVSEPTVHIQKDPTITVPFFYKINENIND